MFEKSMTFNAYLRQVEDLVKSVDAQSWKTEVVFSDGNDGNEWWAVKSRNNDNLTPTPNRAEAVFMAEAGKIILNLISKLKEK